MELIRLEKPAGTPEPPWLRETFPLLEEDPKPEDHPANDPNTWAITRDERGRVVRAFVVSDRTLKAYAELQEQGRGTCPLEAVEPGSIAAGRAAYPAHPGILQRLEGEAGTTAPPIAAACDGACKGNPGPGGWGWLIRLSDGRTLEASGGQAGTTNNRMELEAAAALLEALAVLPRPAGLLEARTDSRYVIEGLSHHLPRWRRNGWRTATGEPVKNRDLWERLAAAASDAAWVELVWVKGHNGHADNERADALASAAAERVAAEAAAAATAAARAAKPTSTAPAGLLPHHWAELQASAIAADVAAANVASFGPGTERHWESERAELVRFKRLAIQTESTTVSGLPQTQPGHLADRLIKLDRRYRHLQAGGWRTLSAELEGLPRFDQWKPDRARPKGRRDAAGRWVELPGKSLKYESPPAFPDGGGLLLPHVPERCWRLICERQELAFPDAATVAGGFWPWALATPALELLICEGWKKALAALSAGWAAVAVPGITMGWRTPEGEQRRLIAALQQLSAPGRPWLIAFDAEAEPSKVAKVGAAAGTLACTLRAAGGQPEIARLPLLPGTDKTGLDDLLAAAGPEALDRALADVGPLPVLPRLRAADRVAPAGSYLGQACPLPSSEQAPLVVLQAPMGCGKTHAISAAVAPLQAEGTAVLMPSHRKALGQAAAERVGVPWCPTPGSDERLQGVAGCWDSWCPDSGLQVSGHGWSGGVLVLDEWAQAIEHLLLSSGTALAKRRASVLRSAAEQLPRMRQTIAADAQMPDWAVRLLERLSGRRAHVIRSDHQPMAGRPLHAPQGFRSTMAAADAFRVKWRELVASGESFFCWTSAQQAGMKNAAQTLAKLHEQLCYRLTPDGLKPGALVDVIDSTTPELAAELAADPDGFAERRSAEAKRQGMAWSLYCTPAISSGISFERWKPAAVIAYAGGRIAPEHVAQAMARVRCPQVPAYVFAPERCPGAALRVGSGSTDPAELVRDLRRVVDGLLGQLETADAEGAWLQAWGELGAVRNRQHYAYRATITGLLEREGWVVQSPEPQRPDAEETAEQIAKELGEIALRAQAAADQRLLAAEPIDTAAARELEKRRRHQLETAERDALDRFRLLERWGLLEHPPELVNRKGEPTKAGQQLLTADREGLRDRLRLGWLLTTPEALALIPAHDQAAIAALDRHGRPFEPDRVRVALSQKVAALQQLGSADHPRVLLKLLERFGRGEIICATDPAVRALHEAARANRSALAAAAGLSPAKLPTGTLRAFLAAVGWRLERAGQINARGANRGALTYRAQRLALPEGVSPQALAACWLAELQWGFTSSLAGQLFAPIQKTCRGEKSATPRPSAPPPHRRPWPPVPALAIPWASAPPPPRSAPLAAA